MGSVPGDHQSFHAWLSSLDGYEGQIASLRFYPPRRAEYGEPGRAFERLLELLELRPYRHQTEALELLASGINVVAATGTASGKSLIYQIPSLAAMANHESVLYLAPTKALAADQLVKLQSLASELGTPGLLGSYDGDTPGDERSRLRAEGLGILTNPDMLHYGILPHHERWARFLGSLRYIVLDELHGYRGVMGAHVANILRRLTRLARHYGASPRFVAASATVGNPAQHAKRLTGETFVAVRDDGAPAPAREFLFWEPPLLEGSDGRRRSSNSEAASLAAHFVRARLKSIFFCNSRKSAELLRRYAVAQLDPGQAPLLQTYRAGYTSEDRRLIEQGFRNGDIVVLAATSALELGIDVGGVDAVVMVGYPGSHMALWQRSGRAGRGARNSVRSGGGGRGSGGSGRALTILIPGNDPLDEYYLHHPDLLTEGSAEDAVADPFNTEIHPLHVDCAAAELPLQPSEEVLAPWLEPRERPHLYLCGERWCHAGRYPHRRVQIRGGSGRRIRLADGFGRVLGESDLSSALRDLHPGAVYLHQGDTYLVAALDLARGRAILLPHIEEFYTQARSETDVEILEHDALEDDRAPGRVHVGRVQVTTTISGYVKKRYITEAVLDERLLDLPPTSFTTQALWLEVADLLGNIAPADRPGALHALEHTLIGLLPAFVLCERADVGGVSYPIYPPSGAPLIFIYDGYPGGVGYSRSGAARFVQWLCASRDLLRDCPCKSGCPRCVLSPKCGNGNQYLDKSAALVLAESLLAALAPHAPVMLA
ncbi:MAG: DEAD/DEAH box helicase [Trueperaceae bacterium]